MRLKLTPKMFLLVASVLILQFALILIFGSTMVEKMYLSDKRNELLRAFRQAQEKYDPSGDYAEQLAFRTWSFELQNQSTTITVWDGGGRLVSTTSLFFMDYAERSSGRVFPFGQQRTVQVTFDVDKFDELLSGGEYAYLDNLVLEVYGRAVSINRSNQEQMYLMGTNGGGDYFLLETPLEPIQAAAGLAVRSSMLGGIIALGFGLLITAVVIYYTAKPIRQMKRVAGNLAKLDFSEKVQVRSRDELGELGESINSMSDAMQSYTTELSAANEQLKRDIEERLRSEQAQKQLVSNISHELKTPLALISGYAEGLREGMAEDPVVRDEYCDVILDESRQMTKLLHQLLGLARLQSGTGLFSPGPVDLSDLSDEMASGFSLPARQRGVTLRMEIDSGLIVLAERDACEQVLRNYLSNAMKHVPDGGLIRVTLRGTDSGRARLEVYNSGSSIPDKALDRVWDSFFRVDEARNRESGEVGLGLSIVKAHMTRHSAPYGVYNTDDGVVFFAEFEII